MKIQASYYNNSYYRLLSSSESGSTSSAYVYGFGSGNSIISSGSSYMSLGAIGLNCLI